MEPSTYAVNLETFWQLDNCDHAYDTPHITAAVCACVYCTARARGKKMAAAGVPFGADFAHQPPRQPDGM